MVKHTFSTPVDDEVIERKSIISKPTVAAKTPPPALNKEPVNAIKTSNIDNHLKTKQEIASFVVKDPEVVKKVKAFAKEKGILIKDAYDLILKKGSENISVKSISVDPLAEAEKALSNK